MKVPFRKIISTETHIGRDARGGRMKRKMKYDVLECGHKKQSDYTRGKRKQTKRRCWACVWGTQYERADD